MCGLTQLMIYLSIFHTMKASGIQNVDPLSMCVGGVLVGKEKERERERERERVRACVHVLAYTSPCMRECVKLRVRV